MAGYQHNPRIVEVARSLPRLTELAEAGGLGAEMRALVEMMDRRDRDLEYRHLNPPSCRVYRTTNQPAPAVAFTTASFDAVRWDSTGGSMWNIAAPTAIVAPVDGVYSGTFYLFTSGAVGYGYVLKAGVFYAVAGLANSAANPSAEIDLKAGQIVTFQYYNGDAAAKNMLVGANYSIEASLTWLRPGV